MNIRNNKASYFVGLTVSACTALVLFTRSCGPGGGQEAPLLAVRGDGICHEVESYPYQRDKNTGQVLCQRGIEAPAPTGTVNAETHAVTCPQGASPVANAQYAPEDCFYGNNVCDSQTDPAQVRDPAGNQVRWDPALLTRISTDAGPQTPAIRYLSGRTVPFPLETEANSIDCMLERVRRDPCAAFTPGSTPVQRPRFTFPPGTVDQRTRQRSQDEIMNMHAHPESLRTGGNYFTIYVGYEESCDRNLAICTPDSLAACWCPNIQECAPPPPRPSPTCGNGRLDANEACDPRLRGRARGGCQEGNHCTRSCTCERDPPGQTCGNNRREGTEECDGNDHSRCGEGASCNAQCLCEERSTPVTTIPNCPFDAPSSLTTRIRDSVTGDRPGVQGAVGAAGSVTITVSASIMVDPNGHPTLESATGSCAGCSGGEISRYINLAGIGLTATGGQCRLNARVLVPPG